MTNHQRSRRRGTSLIEALAAITLLSVGALGIAATGVASIRLEASADRRSRAASVVTTRLELLHRGGCVSPSGTDSALSVSAAWYTTASDSMQQIVDTVSVVDRRVARPHTEVIQTAAPC